MTMLPGLIDLHVHTMFLGHGEYSEYFPFFTADKDARILIGPPQAGQSSGSTS